MGPSDSLGPLREALRLAPDNHGLRLIVAQTLAAAGLVDEAAAEYATLSRARQLPQGELVAAGHVALAAGAYDLAVSLATEARAAGIVDGVGELQHEIDAALGLSGIVTVPAGPGEDRAALEFEPGTKTVTFADVGGLDEVKKAVNRTIILPVQQPELYRQYGRRAGGGVLLYGPPGCGKTLLARATAGECRLPFLNIRIETILDPYFGVSESRLHDTFERARAAAPCVVFIDEIDAIGFARSKFKGNVGRPLVDQLLQELDAIGADNEGMLILAATNAPWDVDEALKRPGRFDRTIFVPPPDQDARRVIIEALLRSRPHEQIDAAKLAKATSLWSGADLAALVERATDNAIDEALESGTERPLTMQHFSEALRHARPSTLEWISAARRYVEFANDGGSYDDVKRLLAGVKI